MKTPSCDSILARTAYQHRNGHIQFFDFAEESLNLIVCNVIGHSYQELVRTFTDIVVDFSTLWQHTVTLSSISLFFVFSRCHNERLRPRNQKEFVAVSWVGSFFQNFRFLNQCICLMGIDCLASWITARIWRSVDAPLRDPLETSYGFGSNNPSKIT
jgi:hypothetical protein